MTIPLREERPSSPSDQPGKAIVLLGGGHAHVEVIRRYGMAGLGHQVLLVSPDRYAPYSGMLPGYIAGLYAFEDFHIDLQSLCERSGATFRLGTAVDLDPDGRTITLADGSILDFGLLSLDIGSTPNLPEGVSGGISVKPISSFTARLGQIDAASNATHHPLRIAVVGQGVAGVEVAFALGRRLAGTDPSRPKVQVTLVGRGPRLLAERSQSARRLVGRALAAHGIAHLTQFDVVAFERGHLLSRDGKTLAVDEVIWTTSSGAPSWLRQTGLALDGDGFVRVDEWLRSTSHPTVFAAGDVAALATPRPKAGVFAVRAGPVLAANLMRSVAGERLVRFRPQRAWLALISLADGRAIADKWGLAAIGRWVSRWKHWSDTRFVRRYR